jgi:hypothetical protein
LGAIADSSVVQAGGSDFYGVIYAPTVPVRVSGTADYYGAVVGKTLRIGTNAGIHFDEAIGLPNASLVKTGLVQ